MTKDKEINATDLHNQKENTALQMFFMVTVHYPQYSEWMDV